MAIPSPSPPLGLPAGATLGSDGQFVWTPAAGQVADHSFDLTASDGQGGTDTKTINLTVLAAAENAPPQFTSTAPTSVRLGDVFSYDADAFDPNS